MKETRRLWDSGPGRVALGAVTALGLVTIVLIAVLWPGGGQQLASAGQLSVDTVPAEVTVITERDCGGFVPCQEVTFELDEGPDSGQTRTVQTGGANIVPSYEVGQTLRVRALDDEATSSGDRIYSIIEIERRGSLVLLAALFIAAVLLIGGIRGALSLAGMLASLIVIALFIVPAIADGSDPVLVAIVGSAAIMLITIPASHGLGAKSIAAILGTTAAFGLAATLATLFFDLASISGLATEEGSFISASDSGFSLRGIVLAGAVIATLGVLDDATVSQASIVIALRRADHSAGPRKLFSRAMSVGRDHVSATVNTLVLAYVGASLPLLLLLQTQGAQLGAVLNSEVVAIEVVSTLVGSIAIVAAVPLTTAIATLLASRLPDELLPEPAGHSH